jgi:hypothetical protein
MRQAVLVVVAILVLAASAAAQNPILLNPQGTFTFDSPDHAKATSYTLGWFLTTDTAKPASTQTVVASTVTGAGPYTIAFNARPAFRRYVLKLMMTAAPPCDVGTCDSPWSEVATWTTVTPPSTGTEVGYTPQNPRGFVLQR